MTPRPWLMLIVGMAAQAAGVLVATTPAFLIPVLTTEHGYTLVEAGLLAAAPSLGQVLTLVAWGAATDRWGERRILVLGLLVTAGAAVWAALAQDAGSLGVALVVAGIGGASASAASARVVVGWFPRERRGLVMGIRQMAQPLGVAVGALVVPALVADGSLARPFWVGAAVCLVLAAACAVAVIDPARSAIVAATGEGGNPYRGSLTLVRIHAASALLVVPQFALSTFGLVWLMADQGWSVTAAGALVAASQLLGAFGRIAVGILSDRVGSRLRPLRWVALSGIALLLLTALTGALSWPIAVAVTYVLASCISVADNGLAFTAVAEIAGMRYSGRALGVQNTGQFAMAAIVPPVVGALIGLVGYSWAFALLALTPALAVPLVPREADPPDPAGEAGEFGATDPGADPPVDPQPRR